MSYKKGTLSKSLNINLKEVPYQESIQNTLQKNLIKKPNQESKK